MKGEVRVGTWIVYHPWVVSYKDETLWYDHEHLRANSEDLYYNVGVHEVEGEYLCRVCQEKVPKGVRQYARMLKLFKDWNIG